MNKRTRPTYTPEFRLESARLTEQGYSIREAAETMSVSKGSIELWIRQLRHQNEGLPNTGAPLTEEQQEIRAIKLWVS